MDLGNKILETSLINLNMKERMKKNLLTGGDQGMLTWLESPAFGMAISRQVTAKFMPMYELLSFSKHLTRF